MITMEKDKLLTVDISTHPLVPCIYFTAKGFLPARYQAITRTYAVNWTLRDMKMVLKCHLWNGGHFVLGEIT